MTSILLLAAAWAGARGRESAPSGPAGLDEAFAPRRVAVLIGIDEYDDPALGPLRFAAADAAAMAGVLGDPERGAFDRIVTLEGEVSRAEIWSALTEEGLRLRRDDTLVVFFAGHGTLEIADKTSLYLLPSDARLDEPRRTGIALEELSAAMDDLPARRQVLVVDACHSGAGRSALSPGTRDLVGQLRGPVPPAPARPVSRYEARLYAAHLDQAAREDPTLGNGVYTHFLVDALAGDGDLDGDGLIDVLEAHTWAMERTIAFTGGEQVPWIETQQVGPEELWLAGDPARRSRAEQAVLAGFERLPRGAVLELDGQARGPGAVAPGAYDAAVRWGERTLYEGSLRLEPGERVDLGRLAEGGPEAWLSAGGSATRAPYVLPTAGLQFSAWWLPPDAVGARWALGAQASWSLGPVGPLGPAGAIISFPAGTIQARAARLAGEELSAGPALSAGVLWRLPETGPQSTLLVTPGALARWEQGWLVLTAEAGVGLTYANWGFQALPTAGLGAGVRL